MNVVYASPDRSWEMVISRLCHSLHRAGDDVDTGHWQSVTDVPHTQTIELTNTILHYGRIPSTVQALQDHLRPSQPWAEAQFKERVSGDGLNPGDTYHMWPYYKGNVPNHQDESDDHKFSHTYMERFWPNDSEEYSYSAGPAVSRRPGIRFGWGDYDDVLQLLTSQPYTRQAYLPIWFPEDTGAHHGERVPCSLGYHFMIRNGELHVTYFIRSCDLFRHFTDDVYLASRLVLDIIDRIKPGVVPGYLVMHMSSLHVFASERSVLYRRGEEFREATSGIQGYAA